MLAPHELRAVHCGGFRQQGFLCLVSTAPEAVLCSLQISIYCFTASSQQKQKASLQHPL